MKRLFIKLKEVSVEGLSDALALIADNTIRINANLETIYEAIERLEVVLIGKDKQKENGLPASK